MKAVVSTSVLLLCLLAGCRQTSLNRNDEGSANSATNPGQMTVGPDGKTVAISGTNFTQTYKCNDGANVTLQGNNNSITLTGHCGTLTLNGRGNSVTAEQLDAAIANGMNNGIVYMRGPKPNFTTNGTDNSLRMGDAGTGNTGANTGKGATSDRGTGNSSGTSGSTPSR